MAKTKLTQKEAIFYQLYQSHREDPEAYIPVFKFMGEVYCKELGVWGFVSHECSARCSEMKKENPELIEYKTIHANSGAKYYGYRLNPYPSKEMIKDEKLRKFHLMIKPRKTT